MKTKLMLQPEPMNYKQQIKENELLTKLRVIRDVHKYRNKKAVANKYGMHRNAVGNIVKAFENKINPAIQKELLIKHNLSKEKINQLLAPIKSKSKKPKSNKRQASLSQEILILKYYWINKIHKGYKGMYLHVKRRRQTLHKKNLKMKLIKEIEILQGLTSAQVRGIYKRYKLKLKKVRTANKETRHLYDYASLAAFEAMHGDTKDLPDKKSLPLEIYKFYKHQSDIPKIEWNIMEAKTRVRFIAYSYTRTSEFGLHFALLVILYLRATNLCCWNIKIKLGLDNGSEFCSGSKRKLAEWNTMFKLLNAEVYAYHPGHDVRKNLIERSHRSDDEDFLIPRADFIENKEDFIKEATGYSYYWNTMRPHTGIEMNEKTPLEKLQTCGIVAPEKIVHFPTLILEDSIGDIKQATEIVRLASYLKQHNHTQIDQKIISKIKSYFRKFSKSAQNVLTYYLTAGCEADGTMR